MRVDIIQIKDIDSDKYFVFIKQFPSVCSQGDTKEDATNKVKSYFKAFINKL